MTGDFREVRRHRYGSMAITSMRWHPKSTNLCYASTADGKIICCNSNDSTSAESIKGISYDDTWSDMWENPELPGSSFASHMEPMVAPNLSM